MTAIPEAQRDDGSQPAFINLAQQPVAPSGDSHAFTPANGADLSVPVAEEEEHEEGKLEEEHKMILRSEGAVSSVAEEQVPQELEQEISIGNLRVEGRRDRYRFNGEKRREENRTEKAELDRHYEVFSDNSAFAVLAPRTEAGPQFE